MTDGEPLAPSRDDDRALVARCVARERAAWDLLVERFARLVHSVVGRTVRQHSRRADDDLVDDLFGQTFLALYEHDCRKLRQWSGRCSLASWIRLVSASVAVDALRRLRDHVSLDAGWTQAADGRPSEQLLHHLIDDTPSPLMRAAELERAGTVRRALDALGPSDRELLVALFDHDRTPGEVAVALGLTAGALYTRKNRALSRLRERVIALEGAEAPLRRSAEGPDVAIADAEAGGCVRSPSPVRPLSRVPPATRQRPVASAAGRGEERDERP